MRVYSKLRRPVWTMTLRETMPEYLNSQSCTCSGDVDMVRLAVHGRRFNLPAIGHDGSIRRCIFPPKPSGEKENGPRNVHAQAEQ
jgi:hypothetical protein